MDDRLTAVESAVRDLQRSIDRLERRLLALETGRQAAAEAPDTAAFTPALPQVARSDFVLVLSFVGRTFVALGGAYLLRALTESGVLPNAAGIAAGLVYGLAWLAFADRAAAGGERLNATFHQFVSVLIAFPLVWEATVRFAVLSPAAAAATLACTTAAMMMVALRCRIQALAWIATIASLVTTLALVASTGALVPFGIWLIAFGVATLWLGYTYHWIFLRWPAALLADVVVLALTMRVSNGAWAEAPLPVVGVQMLLLNAYVASIVVRTLVRARNVNAFEVVQTVAALSVGFGGAVYVARMTGSGAAALALINLAAGAGCYGVAFAFVARREDLRRNFYFYSTLGLILILVSSPMLLADRALALVWAVLALTTVAGARWSSRATLAWHATAYLLSSAVVSGALGAATDGLVASASTAWQPFSATTLIVVAAGVACWLIAAGSDERVGAFQAPRLILAATVVWTVGGWIVAVACPPLCGTPGAGAIAGALATVRTVVLAAAALALAWLGLRPRFREAGWLLYPILVAGGLKLLVEDLPQSRPATLFLALAFYGGALILAPRLTHRPSTSAQ